MLDFPRQVLTTALRNDWQYLYGETPHNTGLSLCKVWHTDLIKETPNAHVNTYQFTQAE